MKTLEEQPLPSDAEDEMLLDDEWLTLHRLRVPSANVRGYVYSHERRCGGHIVAALPFRSAAPTDMEFLMRVEVTPPWGLDSVASAVTGGLERGESPQRCIIRELREETGFEVAPERLIALGECRGTKSTDTVYHLYAAHVEGLEQHSLIGDGSPLEAQASVRWTPHPWRSDDPLCAVMWARLIHTYDWALGFK